MVADVVKHDSEPPSSGGESQIIEGSVTIEMSLELLAQALQLPSSLRVVGVVMNVMTRTALFRVEGPGLLRCAEGSLPFLVPLEDLVVDGYVDWEKLKDLPENVGNGD